ncbi:glycosyltransferase family 4 protein [Anaeroselena agilis]|uniref:Glycosyltransferase family 4 protein n=1 Tax=Anaeroselena agilis TaxID=3063788 RepID=A0ABU3P475_9FIRM|nr:glycosyltransferase family 4 protein [Selenomonadales bacterium 4137-cl]
MRVWLITVGEPLPTDGSCVRLHRAGILADLLHGQGHDVIWWTSTFDHMAKKQRFTSDTVVDLDKRFRMIFLHSCAYASNVSISRILNHIGIARHFSELAPKETKPDVILVSLPTLELSQAAVEYGKRHNVPVVVDVRDLWPDIFVDLFPTAMRPLGRLLLLPYFHMVRSICRQATAIIGITPKIVQWGLDYAGRTATCWDRDFPLAYSGVQPKDEALRSAGKFWGKYGISGSDDQFTVCFFGTMGRQFDLETVIKVGKILEEENAGIRIVLCGTGDNFEKYKQLAGFCKSLIFPGWVGAAEIWTMMRSSHVGLAPYYSTTDFEMSIPNKVIEYLSAGLPIVSSLKGTVAEILSHHGCGVSYKQENPRELANTLADLYRQPKLLETMSKNARRLYEERFAVDDVYGKLVASLEEISSSHKRAK